MFYFFGDIHGSSLKHNNIILTPNDIVFQLGDFGLAWYRADHPHYRDQQYHLNMLKKYPCDILVTPGNHENWDIIEQLPIVEKYGNELFQLAENIFILKRGKIYKVKNNTFFSFGGATSIDKHIRKEGVSWWKQETHETKLEYETIEMIEKIKSVDYILTHIPPKIFVDYILREQNNNTSTKSQCPVAVFLDEIYNILQFTKWYCGHMHVDSTYHKDERIICLYDHIGVENDE